MRLRLVMVLVLGLAVSAPPAQATYPGGNGRIAFEDAGGPGGTAIATVNADGSDYEILATGSEPAWSPAGDRLAFTTPAKAIGVVNADGTGRHNVTQRNWASDPTWSPDGQRLALAWDLGNSECRSLVITRVDGTASERILPASSELCRVEDLEWSPTGNTIVFSARRRNPDFSISPAEIFSIGADGTGLTQLTNEADPATDPEWSPDGSRIVYDVAQDPHFGTQNVVSMRADGTDRTFITQGRDPVWSPDSAEIAYVVPHLGTGGLRIDVKRTNHSSTRSIMQLSSFKDNLDWQRIDPGPPGYPRPKAASPVDVSLVPTYYQCLEPNREHGPPLAFGSCNPPVPGSTYLTVGTVDANGNPPRFVGALRYDVIVGTPGNPTDEADVQLNTSLSDVRCRVAGPACTAGALSDFSGNLSLRFLARITDKLNALGHSITVEDMFMRVDIPCSVTPASAAGSDCSTATSLDAIVPGTVPEGKRSNWQLDQVGIYDGGANGDGSTARTAFAVAGVFVP